MNTTRQTLPSSPKPIPQFTGKGETIASGLVLALTLIGLWLRTHQLAQKSLWLDEAFSVWMSDQPLPGLLSWSVRIDQHPPLYYVLLRAWAQLGTLLGRGHAPPIARAFWVRLPSAIFGTLTIAVFYTLGRRFAGRKAGLLAALILAISPFHIWFGQEARMYTLLALNASLAILGLVRLLTAPPLNPPRTVHGGEEDEPRPPTGKRLFLPPVVFTGGIEGGQAAWTLYILFTAAALWTHNTVILFWIATNLFLLGYLSFSHWRQGRDHETGFSRFASNQRLAAKNPVSVSLRGWLLAQLAVLLLWSPWLAPFVRQAAGVDREFWLSAPTWGALAGALNTFLSAHLPQRVAWQTLAWLAAGMLLVFGVYTLWKSRARLTLLITLFVTPIAGELLVSLRRPIFYTRTLIWTTVPFYLLLAVGAAHALPARPGPKARRRAIVQIATLLSLGILVAANARSLHNYYTKTQKEAWDQAAEHVSQHVQPDDLILFNATWVQLPFDFYFDPPVPVVQHGLPVDLFDRGVLEPKMTEQDLPYLESLVQGHSQVWLIYSHNWYTDPRGLIPNALAEHGRLVDQRHFRGIAVHRYRRQ